MSIKSTCGVLLACCLVISNNPEASEKDIFSLTLEELTNVKIRSSSFFDQTANQSTGSSWVFTHQELDNSPIVFLKDIFEFYTPAIAVGFSSFTGAALGVRGIAVSDNDKTLFMMNGQNLNQVSLYGYQAGMQSTLLGDIDYVEVVNGPGAILYGSGAINNIINVLPKNGHDYQGLYSSIEYGVTDKLKKVEQGYGYSYGEHRDFYLYAGVAQADGFKPDSYLEQGDSAPAPVDPDRKVYEIPDNYRVAGYFTHDALEFQTQFQRVSRSFNKSAGVALAGVWRGHWQTYWASRLKYNWQMNAQRHVEFSIPLEFYDHGVQLNSSEGKKGGRESHTGVKSIFYQESAEQKLAVGASFAYRTFDAQKQYFESDKQLLEESLTGNLHKYGLFGENVWHLSPDWNVSLGLRYDNVDYGSFYEPEAMVNIYPEDLSAITKRLATDYQLSRHQTIKAAYQEGFRYPDVSYFLTFGVANDALNKASLAPLPDLKEETVNSYEISYLQSTLDYSASWELNLYYNIHENTLSWVDYTEAMLGTARYNVAKAAIGFGPGAYANADGKFKAYGTEIAGNWHPREKTSIRGSYAYSHPLDVPDSTNSIMNLVNESGKWANYPEHIFKLAINWGITERTHLNLTAYYSPQVDICVSDCGPPDTASESFHKQDRFRLNTLVKYKISSDTDVSLIVQNILEDNGPPVGYDTRAGTASEGGLGDDSRRIYLSLHSKI